MSSSQTQNFRKCVFIGGKQIGFNCLKQLLKLGIIPDLVVPNLDDNGKGTWHKSTAMLAVKNNLNVAIGKKIREPEIIRKIKEFKPEIIFSIGGTQIISKEVLEIPTLGCVNIHPAMLPKYRGRYSTVWAIFNGEKSTGVTVHWMDSGIDSGPIILQKKIVIQKTDTAKTLYDKFTKTGEELFSIFLRKWKKGEKIISTVQNNKEATFYPKGLPGSGEIDWNWSGKKIYDFVRAMTFEPFPPARFNIGNKEMVIVDKKYFRGFEK